MKKIVIIDPTLEGGICHYSFALCNALAAGGNEVSLITSIGTYELSEFRRNFELLQMLALSPPRRNLAQRLVNRLNAKVRPEHWPEHVGRQVGQYIKSKKAQIVHQQYTLNSVSEPIFWAALRRHAQSHIPLVYTAHNVWPHDFDPVHVPQYKSMYDWPDRIIVHGERLRRQMVQEAGVPERKLSVIPLGNYHHLAEAVPKMSQANARAQLGLPVNSRVILFFGYIRHNKGLDVLLLAFERLLRCQTGVCYRLLIAGILPGEEDWDHSLYGGLCRSLKIADSVHVCQEYIALKDVHLYFEASDLACLPYRSGSQSAALQLSYSFHKPVAVTSVGSLPDAVIEGQTGCLVVPEDPEMLAHTLQVMLDDPAQCQRMGEYAYEWSRDNLSWDSIAQQTMKVYGEL